MSTNNQIFKHINRVEEKFSQREFSELSDREIVEILLALHLQSRRYKQQAKEAINKFGNLRGVLRATDEELQQTCGVEHIGIFGIRFLQEVARRFLKEGIVDKPFYKSSQEIFDYLYHSMRDLKKEVFKVIYLNSHNRIIDTTDLFKGTVENTSVHPREIIEAAIKHGAVHLIFVHNHPSGDPAPSNSDKQLTRDLVFIGNVTRLKVLDHIIIGENTYFSFADAGLIQKYEDAFLNIKIRRMLRVD